MDSYGGYFERSNEYPAGRWEWIDTRQFKSTSGKI